MPDRLFAKTNLVTLLIWGLWWPSMVWGALLLGRAWCMVCPLELVSNLGERLGQGLDLQQVNRRQGIAAGSLGEAWRRLALQTAVVVASAHMAKGLAKFVSWYGFLPYALQDPLGLATVKATAAGTLPMPRPLMGEATVSILGMALVGLGLCLTIREVRPTDSRRCRWPVILSLFGLAGLFIFLTYGRGG